MGCFPSARIQITNEARKGNRLHRVVWVQAKLFFAKGPSNPVWELHALAVGTNHAIAALSAAVIIQCVSAITILLLSQTAGC